MRKITKYDHFNSTRSAVVPINYDDENNSRFIKRLRPVVFRQGRDYCCLLGSNPEQGIVGRGNTADKAIADWEQQMMHRLEHMDENDKVTIAARKILISNRPSLKSV